MLLLCLRLLHSDVMHYGMERNAIVVIGVDRCTVRATKFCQAMRREFLRPPSTWPSVFYLGRRKRRVTSMLVVSALIARVGTVEHHTAVRLNPDRPFESERTLEFSALRGTDRTLTVAPFHSDLKGCHPIPGSTLMVWSGVRCCVPSRACPFLGMEPHWVAFRTHFCSLPRANSTNFHNTICTSA